jgi:hypothetical protein
MQLLLITKYLMPSHCLNGRNKANSYCTFPMCLLRRRASQSTRSGQPVDGPGIHRYIRWAHNNGDLNDDQAREAHQLAERYVQGINEELSAVPSILREVAGRPCVRMFAFDDEMLDLANQLALTKVAQKPFDHAILAGILVSSSRLWARGERGTHLLRWTATSSPGARKERRRTICASYIMMLTFGYMATSLCNSLHGEPTSNNSASRP